MGVILTNDNPHNLLESIPHVYGGVDGLTKKTPTKKL